MAGTLYLCATPIGNLDDMSFRAVETLKKVDIIAAEDTRHSRILLEHFGITKPMESYHEHNKYEKAEVLIRKLSEGADIALITDAGTPVISDPGEVLAARAAEEGICVTSIPGACALITALTLSALPGRRFSFEGFLPFEKSDRDVILKELAYETRTIVLYEAPHRLKRTLNDLRKALGDRRISICRELTKLHEDIFRTTLTEALEYYDSAEPRGEYVLVLEGRKAEDIRAEKAMNYASMDIREHLDMYLDQGMDRKEAMKRMAADRNCSRRDIYSMLLRAGEEDE